MAAAVCTHSGGVGSSSEDPEDMYGPPMKGKKNKIDALSALKGASLFSLIPRSTAVIKGYYYAYYKSQFPSSSEVSHKNYF